MPDGGPGEEDVTTDVSNEGDTRHEGDGQVEDVLAPRDTVQDVTPEEDTPEPGEVDSDTAQDDVESPDAVEDTTTPALERSRVGLVLYYTLEERSGDVVSDRSELAPTVHLNIKDDVTWLEGGGVRMKGGHLIAESPPAKVYEALSASGEFTVELWLRAGLSNQGGGSASRAHIFSLADDDGQSNLTLGQLGTRLEVRLRSGQNRDGSPYLVISGATSTELAHYALTYNGAEVVLYLNGVELARSPRQGSLNEWDPSFDLIVGDGPSLETPWTGDIHHVAIYDRILSAEEIRDHHSLGF